MTRIIAICSQKGGVGKTTTAVNLAAALGKRGNNVLAIDLDPQFALTRRFGMDPNEIGTITNVLAGDRTGEAVELADQITRQVAEGVDLLAADRRLADVEMNLRDALKRENILAHTLEGEVDAYDYVLIDCPPQLGLLTINALCAAEEALVPVDMQSVDALMGATELIAIVQQLAKSGERIRIGSVVRIRSASRRVVEGAVDRTLAEFGLPVAQTRIPDRAEFHHSAMEQQPLTVFAPSGSGARAYRDLAIELEEGYTQRNAAEVKDAELTHA